jgi:hypothetical protein
MTIAQLHIGIPRLQPPEQPDDVLSIIEMRRAILCGARHSRVIRECLEVAEHRELSEEDMYVWLAYEALVRLEELHRACACSKSARATESEVNFDVDGHF